MVRLKWCVECLATVMAVALLLVGCSSSGDSDSGNTVSPVSDDPHGNTPEPVVDTVRAPLFIYEILADIAAADSTDSIASVLGETNILTLLSRPRIEQHLMNHVPLDSAVERAKYETLAAFGVDSLQFAMDSNAVLLAMAALVQNRFSKEETLNFIGTLGEDLKGDGLWNDPNVKIQIADWVVGLDSNWRYGEIRNNVTAAYGGNVPNFERYMRGFVPLAYAFDACTDANAGTVTYVNQGQSAYFANDYETSDHSAVRFICDVNNKEWRLAQPIEKDTVGFGEGEYDREIREGRVIHDNYYIYDAGAWRLATPQEADGFTDLVEVYAELQPDEKVVFIIRHSERTDETGSQGHLTDNGKMYARNLGSRLAEVNREQIYFGYSGYTRTQETCESIAEGYGLSKYSLDVLGGLNGDWYAKDLSKVNSYIDVEGGWVVYSKYAFLGEYADAFYDLEERSEDLLKNEILANLDNMERVNILVTHDYLVVPLLAYTTNGHANVKYYEKWKWVNYMAGVAIIISPDGSVRYIPVKGLETGVM